MTTPAVLVEGDLEKQKKAPKGKESHDGGPSKAGWFTYVALAVVVLPVGGADAGHPADVVPQP